MKFSKAVEKAKPARIVIVQPSAFDPTWERAPRTPIALGLRGVSSGDEAIARAEAERIARDELKHTDPVAFTEAYNDTLMRWIVARAACDPNDASAPHPLLTRAEDQVRFALTSTAVRWLFEEIEQLQIATGPLHEPATDEELGELLALLATPEALSRLAPNNARYCRRLLRVVLLELRPIHTAETEPTE